MNTSTSTLSNGLSYPFRRVPTRCPQRLRSSASGERGSTWTERFGSAAGISTGFGAARRPAGLVDAPGRGFGGVFPSGAGGDSAGC